MVYARTSHNRTVYASSPVGGSGFRSARSAAPPTLHSTHIFASPGNLRFPLSDLQKRHIQSDVMRNKIRNFLENGVCRRPWRRKKLIDKKM
ncbi:hypothetical protein Holit_03254 [Hollandina sp. SP2]